MIGLKKYPTPVWRPAWPFAVGGLITVALIAKAADALKDNPQFNPELKKK